MGAAEKARPVSKLQMTRSDVSQRSSNTEPVKQPTNTPIIKSARYRFWIYLKRMKAIRFSYKPIDRRRRAIRLRS